MFTITLSAAQLQFLEALLQQAKSVRGDYDQTETENQMIDGLFTLLETATLTGS